MKLMGTWNWWAPKPLARLHARFGLHETLPPPAPDEGSVEIARDAVSV
jgi:RND superfamily putative drug exporter